MSDLKLPKIGLGTWQLKGDQCTSSVLKAIEIGYRHVDTAQMYGNEKAVGKALSQETIDRKELIIATKVAVFKLKPNSVKKSTEKSLQNLNLDYVDLLYIHWPTPWFYNPQKTLGAFSELVVQKKIKHIGVSNFTPKLLDHALAACDKPIVANQIEHHPWLQQRDLRKYLNEHDIYLVAYSPIARGKINQMPELAKVADKNKCSISQASLAWIMSHDAVPIPKATGEAHLRDNFEAQDITLDEEDLHVIDSISNVKRLVSPPFVHPKW